MGELLKGKVLFPGTDCILYQPGKSPLQFAAFFPLLASAFHYLRKVPCGRRPLADLHYNPEAFLKGRRVDTEKWGVNGSDDKRLNYLGYCVRYLSAELKQI